LSAEFPNDNPELHLGTIWTCPRVCGPAEAQAGPGLDELADARTEGEGDAIEIVDSLVLEEPIEIVPPPPESTIRVADPEPRDAPPAVPGPSTPPAFADVDADAPRLLSTPPPPLHYPFNAFLQTLSDVACESGYTFAPSEIAAVLDGDPVASAWRAILNGESDDFSLCPTPLDEWASAALARVLGAPQKGAALRRELRARGVAAFGLVDAA